MIFGTTKVRDLRQVFEDICQFVFMQMMADKGIDCFGQLAVDTLLKKFVQLNNMSVFDGCFAHQLIRNTMHRTQLS